MATVTLPNSSTMPKMGQGTWYLGEDSSKRSQEIEALREGVRRGLTLIDTAEMYGDGNSEKLVGEAISDYRDDVFLVSKVSPNHAGKQQLIKCCEDSLKRLGTERLDMYLLHGVGDAAFEDTIEGLQRLVSDGKIQQFGVSNLDVDQMQRFYGLSGGQNTQVEQLLYNLDQRGIEYDLLPWLQEKGLGMMAYSPFDRVGLIKHDGLKKFAQARDITPGQAALAWLLSHDQVIPIPKASHTDRVIENVGALDVSLSDEDHAELDRLFAPPKQAQPLQIY